MIGNKKRLINYTTQHYFVFTKMLTKSLPIFLLLKDFCNIMKAAKMREI